MKIPVKQFTSAVFILCVMQATAAVVSANTGSSHKTDIVADASVGEGLYNKQCKRCHGPKGRGMASYPKLAGNTSDYIVKRLNQYRSGETLGPNTPLMRPQAAKLSDENIANLAVYLSALIK